MMDEVVEDWPGARKRLPFPVHAFTATVRSRLERRALTTDLSGDIASALDRIDALEVALRKAEWHVAVRLHELRERRASNDARSEAGTALAEIRAALSPTPSAQEAPGMTDLMVSPESIGDFLAANPLPPDALEALKNAWVAGARHMAEYAGLPTDDLDEGGYDYAASVLSPAPSAQEAKP